MVRYRTLDTNGLWSQIDSRSIQFEKLIQRDRMKDISGRFDSDVVEIIIGPRQSGKTTLLMMLIHELLAQEIQPEQIYYINLDTIEPLDQFKNPTLMVKQVDRLREKGQRIFLFIDEAQRLESPGKFFKGVYDLAKNIKIFATGSSSLELRAKIREYLTGRKRETYIFPISYRECILHENKIPISPDLLSIPSSSMDEWLDNEKLYGKYLMSLLDSFAIYGGYPAVLNKNNPAQKNEELKEIYQSYVRKDIIDFLKLGKSEIFNNLVKVLASQVGNLINKAEICSLLGSNAVTVTKYMNILEETYVAGYLPPFVSTKRAEIKSAHKCFFVDNGIRNYALGQFNPLNNRPDKGALIENLVYAELVKMGAAQDEKLYFWRTKSGAEVDFILLENNKPLPIEIKAGTARAGLLSKSFHSFLDSFAPEKAIFLNRDFLHLEKVKKTWVYYIPHYWFLLCVAPLRGVL